MEMKPATRDAYLPDDLAIQILEQLPAKSLMRFKCVSKGWRAIIEDPEFVEDFRVRSRNTGARKLLFRKDSLSVMNSNSNSKVMNREFYLIDSEGGAPVPLAVPDFLEKINNLGMLRCAEGLVLVCSYKVNWTRFNNKYMPVFYNNFIWNPTTRKIIQLPPQKVDTVGDHSLCRGKVKNYYFLGFDVSIKKYKVLSIVWNGSIFHVEILILGEFSWRKITTNLLLEPFYIDVNQSCCINGIIYIIIDEACILAFDLSQERFLSLPYIYWGSRFVIAGEVRDRLALIREDWRKIKILEDLESGKWTPVEFSRPEIRYIADLILNRVNDDEEDDDDEENMIRKMKIVRPVGFIKTGEILLGHVSKPKFCGCDVSVEEKNVRRIPELSALFDTTDRFQLKFVDTMLVETIHPLTYDTELKKD